MDVRTQDASVKFLRPLRLVAHFRAAYRSSVD